MKIALVINKRKQDPSKIVNDINALLKKYDIFSFCIDDDITQESIFENAKNKIIGFDLIIAIGGDGTLLGALKLGYPLSIPVLSIYNGTLGFIAEILPDEGMKILEDFIQNSKNLYNIEARNLLSIKISVSNVITNHYAINELVIGKTEWRLTGLKMSINNNEIAHIKSDGIVVATPTGSTAYSLSAGGSIVAPTVNAILLSPIAAHSLTFRPLVIPENDIVKITLDENTDEAMVAIDGYIIARLKKDDFIEATIDKKTFSILRSKSRTFYDSLRDKLNWGK